MKKRTLIIIFLLLTLIIAFSTSGVAYAADGAANETNTEVKFSDDDLIKLIATYCAFGLSIIVGIPLIKTVNRRKKQGYVNSLAEETEYVAKQVRALYASRDKERSKREILKFSIKVTAVADHALTTYTEKQIQGYYELYEGLSDINAKLLALEKVKEDKEEYDKEFLLIVDAAESVADKANLLKQNAEIIERYNK